MESGDAEASRRMAVSRTIAERLVTEAGWRGAEFEAVLLNGHDEDDGVAPVARGECRHYRQDDGGGVSVATIAGGI
jgi:hypothetical protein